MNATNLPGEESRDTQDPDKGRFGGLRLNFSECLDIEDDAPRDQASEPRSDTQERVLSALDLFQFKKLHSTKSPP